MVELNKKERKALAQKKWRAKKRKEKKEQWWITHKMYTNQEKDEIKKLRAEGYTLKEIAIKFNWSTSTIWKICKNVEKKVFFSEELKEIDKI